MRMQYLLLFLLLCMLLTGCAADLTGGYLIPAAEGSEEYVTTLNGYLSGYETRNLKENLYVETADGNATACFDVQAMPAIDHGVGRYWYSHVLATVVIAVDRTRTDAVITGWKSLTESQIRVGMSSTSVIRNMLVIGALSYGLNPAAPAKQDALDFLEQLSRNGGFELDESNAPILLCLDYEAAAWNRNGQNYEVIVPEEGTISYRLGLLSDVPLTLESGLDESLLSAGFPLASGERPQGFPSNYQSAHTLRAEDYDWFLELAGDSSRDLRREVFHTRLYTTADLREHILSALLIAVVILLWKGTVSHRMLRHDVQWIVGAMCWSMVGWLLLRLFKYQLFSEGILCRICWYGYYIFQLILPVALLCLTEIIDRPEGERSPLRPLWPPFVFYVLSVILVLTNDLHHMVFRFEPGGNWNSDYYYGPGYWIIMAGSLLALVLAVGKLLCMGRRNTHWGSKIFPLLFCAGLLAYIIAYICRVPLVWESDLTVCICIISILFFETVLHSGLIPVNIQYKKLFTAAPVGLTLFDEKGRAVLSSCGTVPISPSIWRRMHMDPHKPLLRDSDTQLHAIPVHNGMAVWQEDISQLNRLKKEIQNVQSRLEAANNLLQEEEEIKKRLMAAETKRDLFEQLNCDIEHRITALSREIEKLPETGCPKGTTAYIALCLCHIKRRCNLFFLDRQGESLLREELSIYLNELAELAGYVGIQMLIRYGRAGALDIRCAALCYDYAFETILWMLKSNASVLIGYMESEGSNLIFRFLPGCDSRQWHYSEKFMAEISALGGEITYKDLDDAVGICMTLPLGGENCD